MKKIYSIVLLYICTCCSTSNSSKNELLIEANNNNEIIPPNNFPYTFGKKPTLGKEVYIPNELKNNNFNSNVSKWSYQRSASSDNVILFWENGFGQYPSKTLKKSMRVNVEDLLNIAEEFYAYYIDTMKFIIKGNSKTDTTRMMILLNYQEEWLATGAGYDNEIGALWINPTTTLYPAVIAHEFGHSFQYQVACDENYGFRDQNYVGTFWEQCAQYMSWQIHNNEYTHDLPFLLENIHKNFSHEDIRYQSIYLQEYWKEKHGVDFLGKLWRESTIPEHPIEAYKRITEINQEQFNDEIFEYACKNITWDYPLGSHNKNYIKSLSIENQAKYKHKTKLNLVENDYYQIDKNQTPQSYGYNAIELIVPESGTNITANFIGIDGKYSNVEGWRYGFVIVKENETPVYGIMENSKKGNTSITIPENTKTLWFVVTGAPNQHLNHVWDENPSNDKNYPYKVMFSNTQIK